MTCESMGFGGGALGCRNCLLDTNECRACVESSRVTCGAVDEPGKVLGMVSWGKTAALLGLQRAGTARFIRISSSLEMVVEHRIERTKHDDDDRGPRLRDPQRRRTSGPQRARSLIDRASRVGKFYDHTTIQEAALTADGRTLLGFSPSFNVLNWISVDDRGAARPAEPAEAEHATYDSKAARRPVTLDPPVFRAPTQGPMTEVLEGYSAAVEGGRVWISSRRQYERSQVFTDPSQAMHPKTIDSCGTVKPGPPSPLGTRVVDVAFVRDGG